MDRGGKARTEQNSEEKRKKGNKNCESRNNEYTEEMQESCKERWLSAWTDAHDWWRMYEKRQEKRRVGMVADIGRRGGRGEEEEIWVGWTTEQTERDKKKKRAEGSVKRMHAHFSSFFCSNYIAAKSPSLQVCVCVCMCVVML